VGDTAIGLLFSAFILVNGIIIMPAGYLADRWIRTRAMAVTIALWSVISALGGVVPTTAFGLLVVIRASLGFGQAVTEPRAAVSSPTTTGPSAGGGRSPFSSA
jgi:MFS family permease